MIKRLAKRAVRRVICHARRVAYRVGHRPKPGTVLYSPSLDMRYAFGEGMVGFRKPPIPRLEMAPGVEYMMTHRGRAMRHMVVTHMVIDSEGRATVDFEDVEQYRNRRTFRGDWLS